MFAEAGESAAVVAAVLVRKSRRDSVNMDILRKVAPA